MPPSEDQTQPKMYSNVRSFLGHPLSIPSLQYVIGDLLGEGSYGRVDRVHIQNDELKKIISAGKPINWVCKTSEYYFPEESKIQSRFYVTLTPFKGKCGSCYTFSEYLPGRDLAYYENSSFSVKMQILCQLANQVSDFHHFRVNGVPFVHGDIRSGNIKVDRDKVTQRINAYIYDFGFSSTHETENCDQLMKFKQIHRFILNAAFFPKEMLLSGQYGFKTDVYMFGSVLQQLLKKIPDKIKYIRRIIDAFLSRVRSSEYKKRPTSDEVLKFCLTLNRLHLLTNDNIDDQALQIALTAKLIIMASGCWDLPTISDSNWNTFDFDSHPLICEVICILSQKSFISKNIGHFLMTNPDMPAAIKHLKSIGCLNDCTMSMLELNPALATQFKSAQPLDIIKQLQGSFDEKCTAAKQMISYQLANCRSQAEVTNLLAALKENDYLYKRQGFFTFSIFNHKYHGEKVSRTWLEIVKLHEDRIQTLAKLEQDNLIEKASRTLKC